MSKEIVISFVCPVLNEERFIDKILTFYKKQDTDRCELILVDGGSTDKTVTIISSAIASCKNIVLLENKDRFQNFALNIGIRATRGKYIIRLDAHTDYESDYAIQVVNTLTEKNADIAGGPMRPAGLTNFQKAVGYATEQKFGIGDSGFHNVNYEGETDSVYLGAYRKALVDEIGYYDEELVCNEDDEFAYRARSKGKLIYLNPLIRSYYQPRNSFVSLLKQYFRYGYYKPLVFVKTASGSRPRHWIPAFFVIYILVLLMGSKTVALIIPLLLYLVLSTYYSFWNKNTFQIRIYTFLIFPCLHVAYGAGFLCGSIRWFFK